MMIKRLALTTDGYAEKGSGNRRTPEALLALVLLALAAMLIALWLHGYKAVAAPHLRMVLRSIVIGAVPGLIVGGFVLCIHSMFRRRRTRTGHMRLTMLVLTVFAFGAGLNVYAEICTTSYDNDIRTRWHFYEARRMVTELAYPSLDILPLRRTAAGGYELWMPVDSVTDRQRRLIFIAEDIRGPVRIVQDFRATLRAIWRTVTYRREGGADLWQQVAGILFDIHTGRRVTWRAMEAKVRKVTFGLRLSALYPDPDKIVAMYARIAYFGSVKVGSASFELRGLDSASRVYWGVPASRMTVAQETMVVAILSRPKHFHPYCRRGETQLQFLSRMADFRARFGALLDLQVKHGSIPAQEAAQARLEFLYGLRHEREIAAILHRPFLKAVVDEVSSLSGVSGHHLRVEVAVNPDAQTILNQSVMETMLKLQVNKRIAASLNKRPGDKVLIECEVLSDRGGRLAEVGAVSIPGESSSYIKPALAGCALEYRIVPSVDTHIPGTNTTLRSMLVHSDQNAAKRMAELITPGRLATCLAPFGFSVDAAHLDIRNGFGSGVLSSPATAASGNVFHYGDPGTALPRMLVQSVVDAETGAHLWSAQAVRVLQRGTAEMLRGALEDVAIAGTCSTVLKTIRQDGLMTCKTGTGAYYDRKSGQLRGNGGSWVLAADEPTHTVMACRVRFASGEPFPSYGAESAAWVIRGFLDRYRAALKEKTK